LSKVNIYKKKSYENNLASKVDAINSCFEIYYE
jgi:hypothetical protein